MQSSTAGVLITAHTEDISKARTKHIILLTAADKKQEEFKLSEVVNASVANTTVLAPKKNKKFLSLSV